MMFQKIIINPLILIALFVFFQFTFLFAGETGKIANTVIDKQPGILKKPGL